MSETIGWITVAMLAFIGGIGVAEWIISFTADRVEFFRVANEYYKKRRGR